MDTLDVVILTVVGLAAGLLGGLAGVGGSMVMIPGLGLVMGYTEPDKPEQHLYAAAAMLVNVLVSAPAARAHQKAGAVRWDIFKVLAPAMAVAIIVGVLISNEFRGVRLKQGLAVFILAYCALNIYRVYHRRKELARANERLGVVRLIIIACTGGLVAGILGLGGGVVIVPLLQIFCRVRLREAIATSLATMTVTAILGAGMKIYTLTEHGLSIQTALLYAAALGPGAILGGALGAALNHRLPLSGVRIAISVLLIIVAAKQLDLLPF
ncbi:MAG: sulfite exporter TauE/SafE family protein [Phycisphaeraceae bacterium]|nr:sulfite exporter TauE/SafE family protein [Phycisphaeraceae bacterium]MCW5754881.1 sulfite exporter TauE/SafE family protein [Phycisphaeraceae bacterium]